MAKTQQIISMEHLDAEVQQAPPEMAKMVDMVADSVVVVAEAVPQYLPIAVVEAAMVGTA
ncbi:hypothetical protein ABT47_15990 [Shewanella xiamenensis]|nr:hypothetical protein ABT47_15990 [Shewanella xiamenensis]